MKPLIYIFLLVFSFMLMGCPSKKRGNEENSPSDIQGQHLGSNLFGPSEYEKKGLDAELEKDLEGGSEEGPNLSGIKDHWAFKEDKDEEAPE